MKAIINADIYDFYSFRKNSYILFEDEIKEIGDMNNFPGADKVYDCKGNIVMPGLINCHTHIYSIFSRGASIPFNPKTFQDILEQVWWKLDSKLDKESIYQSALAYGCDCIGNGVTTIIDHHASGIDIIGSLNEIKKGICDYLGMRGIFCFETSDRFEVEKCIDENMSFASQNNEKFKGIFGMHASMSLSDDTLMKISSVIGDTPIHIHVAESEDDQKDCINKYGKRVIKRLDDFGLLKPSSILAHCVHIDDEEAKLIKRRKCNVVMNPTSNMNNTVGLANYELFRNNNIPCMIGNDGLGSNITREYLNIVFSMKNRLGNPMKFDLDDLRQTIITGYEYVSNMLDIKIGKIKTGYKADLISIPYNAPTDINENNILGHIFFGVFDGFKPKYVWCSGKNKINNYEFNVDIDIDKIYSNSKLESRKVWKRF